MAAKNKARKLTARVTHLEMTARPHKTYPLPSQPRAALLHAEHMRVHFYRYLYEQVGKAHHWYLRRVMKDKELAAILAHNRDEEKEHAAMVLEWIRRRDPSFDKELKDYLFSDGDIAHG